MEDLIERLDAELLLGIPDVVGLGSSTTGGSVIDFRQVRNVTAGNRLCDVGDGCPDVDNQIVGNIMVGAAVPLRHHQVAVMLVRSAPKRVLQHRLRANTQQHDATDRRWCALLLGEGRTRIAVPAALYITLPEQLLRPPK